MAENNSLQALIKSKSKAGEKIFSTILNDALKKKAESIHFCPNEDELILFYRQNKTLKKMSIYFGVHSVEIQLFEQLDEVIAECVKRAKEENLVKPGDYVVVTAGYPFEEKTETNLVHAFKIL